MAGAVASTAFAVLSLTAGALAWSLKGKPQKHEDDSENETLAGAGTVRFPTPSKSLYI